MFCRRASHPQTPPRATPPPPPPPLAPAPPPPLNAGVLFHPWGPLGSWALRGGCYRSRVVITGSVTPTATTFGLGGNMLCSAKPSPTPSTTAGPSHSP